MNKIINKMPDWLRWLLLVPSIVFYFLASALIMKGFLEFIGITQAYYGAYLIFNLISLFFVSGFIILIAAYIAPKGKLLVSFIFAALLFILFVFLVIYQRNIDIFSLICISGPIAGFIAVKNIMCNKNHIKQLSSDDAIVMRKRKRKLFLAVCIFILIVAAGSIIMHIVITVQIPATLFINGKEIPNVSAKIRYEDTVLPFTEVLKGAGFNVTWRDNNIADVTYEDKTYILNIQDGTLVEKGFDADCDMLLCPPGSSHCYWKAEGRELYVDENTIFCTIYDFGKIMDVDIDRGKSIVYVTLRND